jgi:hypothetical protein
MAPILRAKVRRAIDGCQVRQFEKSVSQIRAFADRIETEFNTLEYLIGKRR